MLEEQRVEAQQTLDELFSKHLLPFKLSAHKVDCIGTEEYIVRFRDSRLPWVDVAWQQGESFKDVFRSAVLQGVERVTGPLH